MTAAAVIAGHSTLFEKGKNGNKGIKIWRMEKASGTLEVDRAFSIFQIYSLNKSTGRIKIRFRLSAKIYFTSLTKTQA